MQLIRKANLPRGGRLTPGFRRSGVTVALPVNSVYDFDDEAYFTNSLASTFRDSITHSRAGNATMVDSDGLLKWAPHNLLTYSEQFDNAVWSKQGVTAGADIITEDISTGNHRVFNQNGVSVNAVLHAKAIDVKPNGRTRVKLTNNNLVGATFDLVGSGSVVSGSGTITPIQDGWYRISSELVSPTTERLVLYLDNGTGISYTGDGSSGIYLRNAHLYRSDLGGMVNNYDRGDSYVPTTSYAVYLPRRGHHVYNGSIWVNEGLLHESEARTNLLLNSGTLSTQSVTVTAVPHTLHFAGTGTVTLSGTSIAGPLVGTGTGENNRVNLTFTPTAGTLIVTVTGTVTNAQLEAGSTPSSYIPTSGATATRAAETLTVPAANLPWNPLAVSIQMDGRVTYADEGVASVLTFATWELNASNRIFIDLDTDGASTGEVNFNQTALGGFDRVVGPETTYSPGILVLFNIASRHGSTFVNGAVDGVALTANTTPVALPDLSATDLSLGYDFMGTIKTFRIWAADLGDTGIAEASA
jgi:hypothetical protein